MSENFAEQHRNVKFENAVSFELRAKPGILYPLVGSSDNYSGSGAARIDNIFDDVHMGEKVGRNADTNLTDPDSRVRFIKPGKAGDVGILIEREDQKVTEVDIGSPIAAQVAKAARRWHDDEWLAGYFGNAWEGENGDVAVPFDSNNVLPHGSAGLTKTKLLDMRELMRLKDIDFEEDMPILLITPKQETQLLGIDEYAKADYNEFKPLVRGEIKPWLGFRFVKFNPDSTGAYKRYGSLTLDGSTRKLPCFVPRGLHRGVWTEFWGDIGPRRDKRVNQQIYGEARSAVVRTNEDYCFIFEATES